MKPRPDISLQFGAGAPPLREQLAGYFSDQLLERFDRYVDAITLLRTDGMLREAEFTGLLQVVLQRLHEQGLKEEPDGHTTH